MTYKTKPLPHQEEYFLSSRDKKAFACLWEQGCYDEETEFLTPNGWVKFPDYVGGMQVAQWDRDTQRASFVIPERYIKLPCDDWYHLKGRGVDQLVSYHHRLPVMNLASKLEETVQESYERTKGKPQAYITLPNIFTLDLQGEGLGYTEQELRLLVAIMADGSFPSNSPRTKRVCINIKKERKKQRLRFLLGDREHKEVRTKDGYSAFSFLSPERIKNYPADWWARCSNQDRDIILDEVWHWDGTASAEGRGPCFFSTCKADADFIQFLATSSGLVARITEPDKIGCYTITTRGTRMNPYFLRHQNIQKVEKEGIMYSFTVPTSWLVVRRNGFIGLSGNCGKSKPHLDTAAYLYRKGEIDCLLVVAPNGVHRNWITDEIPTHMPDDVMRNTLCFYYDSDKAPNKGFQRQLPGLLLHKGLLVLAISYSGFMTEKGKAFVWKLFRQRRCLYILDESHYIKEPGIKRTKSILASSRYAPYRRILTGTPVAQGPFDIYAQVKFIDENFWKDRRLGSFAAFKQHFGIWRTASQVREEEGYDPGYDLLLGYKNLGELEGYLKDVGHRLTKETAGLNLPPKLYSKRYFEMTKEQTQAYNELVQEYITQLETGDIVEATLAIVRLLRLQQITCGYIAVESDEPVVMLGKKNPRLEVLKEIVATLTHPAIIWCRFTKDIDQIMQLLGDKARRYDGQVNEDQRAISKSDFQTGKAQFFVANPAAGKEGLTLNQAKTVIYYSNSFKLIDRLQSEDRAHRIGQTNAVNYIDIVCPGTVDEKIVKSLREKFDIASQITGDQLKEWL